jgi:PAP2 superfamily
MTLRDFATQNRMDLLDTVRLLAMGNMVPTDAGMACFDSKYTYKFWRPFTAIRNADIDGNSATTANGAWSPLAATPNHPEYPSQHGCVTSALARVLAHAVDSNQINATIWGATAANTTGLVTSRTYPNVQSILDELINARIWIGFHFRSSVVAGENLGTSVANWELQRNFQLTNGKDG